MPDRAKRVAPISGRSGPQATAGWSGTMVRGLRPNDLSGKAGEIAAELEERLERGEFRFGETLSIYALAEQFEASRQPVASAVLYLRGVGYLEIIPKVGCRVVSPSAQEVADFYVLFARSEAVINRFAAERYEGSEGEELQALNEVLGANPFQSLEDRRAMADGVSIFHDRVSAMARSHSLLERISNFRRMFRFYLSQNKLKHDPLSGPPVRLNELRTALTYSVLTRRVEEIDVRTDAYILSALEDWKRVV